MNKVIFLVLFIVCNKLAAQDVTETVSYINTILKARTYNPIYPEIPSKYDNLYDTISVDKHGKLECVRFLSEKETGKITYIYRFYAYLKSLRIGKKKDYTDYYVMTIECAGYHLCFGGISLDRLDVFFSISTENNRDKLYNAFSHLFDLAKENNDFYEKDPFGN